MPLRINPVAFANFLLQKFAKILQFFSAPCKLVKKYFFPKIEAISCFQSIVGLKINFYPVSSQIIAIEVITMAVLQRKCVEAKIAQAYH